MDQPTLIALCLIAVAAGVLTSVVVTSGRSRRVLDRIRDEPALVVGAVMATAAAIAGAVVLLWAANASKTLSLTSTYTITSSGVYYLLCAQAASTATASLVSTGQSTFTGIAQQAPVLGVRVDETGLSTPPSLPASFTIGTQNAGLIPYAYCS